MKKIIISLTICFALAIVISSCQANKKCPAYKSQSHATMGVSR